MYITSFRSYINIYFLFTSHIYRICLNTKEIKELCGRSNYIVGSAGNKEKFNP